MNARQIGCIKSTSPWHAALCYAAICYAAAMLRCAVLPTCWWRARRSGGAAPWRRSSTAPPGRCGQPAGERHGGEVCTSCAGGSGMWERCAHQVLVAVGMVMVPEESWLRVPRVAATPGRQAPASWGRCRSRGPAAQTNQQLHFSGMPWPPPLSAPARPTQPHPPAPIQQLHLHAGAALTAPPHQNNCTAPTKQP